MVKPIMRDVLFLGQKSIPATEEDLQVGRDLQDTLAANREACVGMAANMIGVKKRIIIVNAGFRDIIMFNPVIVRKSGPYETEEGCLSLPGVRKTKRYQNIEIEYYDWNWKKQRQKFTGWPAQICQHEMDHLADGRFLQPHRSYVVNLAEADLLSAGELRMRSGARISIPRGREGAVRDAFQQWVQQQKYSLK